jgi:hypothetical protein
MAGSIKAMQQWAEKIEDANTGYDQNQRWTFLDKANRKLIPNREADCSTVVAAIVYLAGYPINISGTCYTGNLAQLLKDAGWTIYRFTNLSQVKAGDVLIAPRHHTEFAYTANKWYSAHIDRSGDATGGQAGNQTGGETKFQSAYNRSGGWTYLARPPADATPGGEDMPLTRDDAKLVATTLLKTVLGSSGPTVGVALQQTYRHTLTLLERAGVQLTPEQLEAIAAAAAAGAEAGVDDADDEDN